MKNPLRGLCLIFAIWFSISPVGLRGDGGHDSNEVLDDHARSWVSEAEMNGLRAGLTEAELLDALPEWDQESDQVRSVPTNGAEWPASRLYEITNVITVSGAQVASSSTALAGYSLVASRRDRMLRIHTESGARADYTITDDTAHVLSDRVGQSHPELLPALRATRMTGSRPEHVILTEESLAIVSLGFNTMDISITHATRASVLSNKHHPICGTAH